jgi:DNA polymerase
MSRQFAALRSLKSVLQELQAGGQQHIWISPEAKSALASLPTRTAASRSSTGTPSAGTTQLAAAKPPGDSSTGLTPSGDNPAQKLASLEAIAADWKPARELGSLRDTMVFAVGNPSADLMLVGEAPGSDEERQREPFVGKAGQKLNQILKAMGLERGEIYISNICKFRPAMPDQGTGNRNGR